jgi:hypothetical protein
VGEVDHRRAAGFAQASDRRLGVRCCLGAECEESFQAAWPEQRFCGGARCRSLLMAWAAAKGSGDAAREVEDELGRGVLEYGERECRHGAPGCEGRFEAKSPTQIYCVPCRAVVTREQARDRQRRLRESRRLAEERRRADERGQAEQQAAEVGPAPEPAQGRCHAPHEACQSALCDRPGCYRTPVAGAAARYCGPDCAAAVRRVLDRERQWRRRGTPQGRLKRRLTEAGLAAGGRLGRPVSAPP